MAKPLKRSSTTVDMGARTQGQGMHLLPWKIKIHFFNKEILVYNKFLRICLPLENGKLFFASPWKWKTLLLEQVLSHLP
jgi:hypothetical protein